MIGYAFEKIVLYVLVPASAVYFMNDLAFEQFARIISILNSLG